MSLFPKARPSPRKREPRVKRWPVHRCIPSGDETWAGEVICLRCGSPESFRVHQVEGTYVGESASIEARKLGEAGE